MAQYHRLSLVEREKLSRMLAAGRVFGPSGRRCAAPRAPCPVNSLGTRPRPSPIEQ